MATKSELRRKVASLEQEIEWRQSKIVSLEKTMLRNEEIMREKQERIDELQARICAGEHHLVMVRDTPYGTDYVCIECGQRKTVTR